MKKLLGLTKKTVTPQKQAERNDQSMQKSLGRDNKQKVVENEEQYGMFPLRDRASSEEGLVDIVAIHGLNGHYSKTWSKMSKTGQEVNWLQDLLPLPEAIPESRVMSYGYNSTVQFSKSVAGIGTFAEKLLEELLSYRRSAVEKRRPIIFICHSLGGIVFKQALVRARERERYTELLKCIRGVAFFGTPHRGSSLAAWGGIIANVLKSTTFGTSTNDNLLRSLQSNAEVLNNISKSFVERTLSLRILSFYESEMMDYLNCRVVEEWSATLSLPNETTIAIDGNHNTICKFADSNEKRYRVIWTNLKSMAEDAQLNEATYTTKLSPEEQRVCVQSFYASNYETYRKRNPSRVAGTCEWFLKHQQYRQWRKQPHSSLLWVSADPGCGKSVLSSFLVEHLRNAGSEDGTPQFICHFFFKDDSEEQRSAVLALNAILHQIFANEPSLRNHAFQSYENKGRTIFNDFASLWDIFVAIINDPGATNIICVVDGLDECEIASQSKLLDALVALYSGNSDWITGRPYLKVIMMSRPDNLIKNKFIRLPTIRLRGEDETGNISKDVNLVIQDRMTELLHQGISNFTSEELQSQLVAGADRTFLWATLMIQLLTDAVSEGASRNELLAILHSRDIYAIYNRLLKKSSNAIQARKLLCMVIAATRPLTLEEMNIALAVSTSVHSFTDLDAELKSSCENYVKSLCGNFVRVIHSTIYLVHQTAREFLLKEELCGPSLQAGKWQHSISLQECQEIILDTCILYLFILVPANSITMPSPRHFNRALIYNRELSKVANSLKDYACKNWPAHFILSRVDLDSERMNRGLKLCDPDYLGCYNWLRLDPESPKEYCLGDFGIDTPCYSNRSRFSSLFNLSKHEWQVSKRETLQLHHAILLGLENMVLQLLQDKNVDVNDTSWKQRAALHLVAGTESLGILDHIIEEKAEINARDVDGSTPLHIAIRYGSIESVKSLLKHGADINMKDNRQRTALGMAAESRLPSMVEMLLDNKAEIGRVDEYSTPALILLALKDENSMAPACDSTGDTPMRVLRRRPSIGFDDMVRLAQKRRFY